MNNELSTDWDRLSYPRLCGLAAKKPTKLSQAMHNAGFRALNLPFSYVAFDVEDVFDVIMLMRKLGARGFSLSVPHKETAMPYVDGVDEHAEKIGAINTVINTGRALYGANTDWIGVVKAIEEAGVSVREKSVVIAGAGGAAKAAIYALKMIGAARVHLVNRTFSRAEETAQQFGVSATPIERVGELIDGEPALVVNATPSGSHLDLSSADNPLVKFFAAGTNLKPAYFEMVTSPTAASATARQCGGTVIEGSRMLFYQALEQFRLFTEQEPPADVMSAALDAELKKP